MAAAGVENMQNKLMELSFSFTQDYIRKIFVSKLTGKNAIRVKAMINSIEEIES